jgi:hypothetical protein
MSLGLEAVDNAEEVGNESLHPLHLVLRQRLELNV